MAEVTHIPNDNAAMQTILNELDWAYESMMLLVDLIGDIPGHDRAVNYPNLRSALADRARESCRRRDAALSVLNGEAV